MWLGTRALSLVVLLTAALATEELLFPNRLPAIQGSLQTRLCQAAGVPYCSYNTATYSDNGLLAEPADEKVSTYAPDADQSILLIPGNADGLTRTEGETDEDPQAVGIAEFNPVKRDSAFHSWGGKRDQNWNTPVSTNSNHQISSLSTTHTSANPVIQLIKKASAFSSWGGKRYMPSQSSIEADPSEENYENRMYLPNNLILALEEPEDTEKLVLKKSFSSWGGKRKISSWGGKRIPTLEKPRRAFSSWGGKRMFSSWGGKRDSSLHEAYGEAEKANKKNFASWGGKRKLSSWGLKGNVLDDIQLKGKKSFSSWGGKRQMPCSSCNNILETESNKNSKNDKNLSIISFSTERDEPIATQTQILKEDNKKENDKDYNKDMQLQNGNVMFQNGKAESSNNDPIQREEPELLQMLELEEGSTQNDNMGPPKTADINRYLQENMRVMRKRDSSSKQLTNPSVNARGRFSSWGGKRAIKALANQLSKVAYPQILERQYRRGADFYAWGG